ESQNISKPPYFVGNNYSHWKTKMTIFIQSLDYNLWDLIIDGPNLPTEMKNSEIIAKPRSSYNDEDRKRVQKNAKAKHIIICAINSSDFNRVSSCISAKKMWDRLEVTYEESSKLEEIICFECNKFGHYKSDYLRLKKKEHLKKKKAMLASWDDSDESSSDEDSH
ncbi:LOW QUALITY PROTEIN: DUF4219 domain-containing protein, partial [Cephalotus follicularis]